MTYRTKVLLLAIYTAGTASCCLAQLQQVASFGSNPGTLNMYKYVPSSMPAKTPLVLVIHGCTQSAASYENESEWSKLAEKYKFYTVYAEQPSSKGPCFTYADLNHVSKDKGETMSIKQMVDKMLSDHSIDSSRIFVTGFSAGGVMAPSQLASYPWLYKAGAIMAGFPFKAMQSSADVLPAVNGQIIKTPQQWGDIVRNENPGYNGPWPVIATFHGTTDANVNFQNTIEIVKQWTNIHGADQTEDAYIATLDANPDVAYRAYNDAGGNLKVVRYDFNMAHGISVHPTGTDNCNEGGNTATYAIDKNHYSSYWVAKFFGLIPSASPYVLSGDTSVTVNEAGLIYTVPSSGGSSYSWTVPGGAAIVSGQGTNQVGVNWGLNSGDISVTETDAEGCTYTVSLYVTATVSSGIRENDRDGFILFPNPVRAQSAQEIRIEGLERYPGEIMLRLYDITGKDVTRFPVIGGRIAAAGSKLPSKGIYFYDINDPEIVLGTGRLVVL